MIESQLKQSQSILYIQTWLNRNNYSNLFQNDLGMLLAENRRSRPSNVIKYGSIPYEKDHAGRVKYKLEDIQDLCENRLKPICKMLEKERLKKADRAAARASLPYAS